MPPFTDNTVIPIVKEEDKQEEERVIIQRKGKQWHYLLVGLAIVLALIGGLLIMLYH